ncbi:Uncharacterized protein BM_BM1072 [Brugia malayi]|uniref:Uncharacterized protein n=2 Tax=Brugia TaxID=6278 RepID=A0A4E9FYE9_BRUMA|nr:Uncharacterized protein BM_BM1072 [Brugia malayi]VIO97973.1 Uncharacterized protein BM_BM1072 [Brugia malayi]
MVKTEVEIRVHNPSPYLRRYRLPAINSSATVAAYDDLLSPIDNCAKLAFISTLNFQNKQFCISKPNIPPNTRMIDDNNMELNCDKTNSTRTSAISYIDSSSPDQGNPLTKSAIDFEFRFVATELEKKCHEYDRIAQMTSMTIGNTTNGTRKSDEKML